jgi:ssDNA thymidine ADP-ribosyltransferase, DarT
MPRTPANTCIYHITDVANLPRILQSGGLYSDAALAAVGGPAQQIGYGHIKQRRMTQYRVDCCGNRFVGEFVPFYFCPRSVMLYTINQGNTGLPLPLIAG